MIELTTQQVTELVELLDARQLTLESMAQEHAELLRDSSLPEGVSPAGDSADLADIELVRAQENAAIGRDVRELRKIQVARVRIGSSEAGICSDCGEGIGFERLQVQPTTARCVFCQDIHEHIHLFRPVPLFGAARSF